MRPAVILMSMVGHAEDRWSRFVVVVVSAGKIVRDVYKYFVPFTLPALLYVKVKCGGSYVCPTWTVSKVFIFVSILNVGSPVLFFFGVG